jgi:hypothetical protein
MITNTPSSDSSTPNSWRLASSWPMNSQVISTVNTGMKELSSSALVAVVYCTAKYTRVLKPAMPRIASSVIRRHWASINGHCAKTGRMTKGSSTARAMAQRQNDRVTGGMSACMARDNTKLPAQNRTVRVSSK